MKLVVDTNVIISALLKDSTTRSLLTDPRLECHAAPYILEEIEDKKQLIQKKTGLPRDAVQQLLAEVTESLNTLPKASVDAQLTHAHQVMDSIDPNDARILAAALATGHDIWSDDKHFQQQDTVPAHTTAQVLDQLQLRGGYWELDEEEFKQWDATSPD